MKLRFLFWLFLSLLFFYCAPFKVLQSPSSSFNSFYFKGKAYISIAAENFATNFGAEIQFTLDDTFHIQVQGPLGMDVGEVFVVKNRYLYLNHMDHQMINGENDDMLLERIFQIPLSPALLSHLPLINYFYQTGVLDSVIKPFVIQNIVASKGKINEITLKNGSNMLSIQFEKYKKVDDYMIPLHYLISNFTRNQKLKITFKEIKKINHPIGSFPIVPYNYRQLTI